MEFFIEILYKAAFSILFTWVLVEFLKLTRNIREDKEKRATAAAAAKTTSVVRGLITTTCGIFISLSHLVFCLFQIWKHGDVLLDSLLPAAAWILFTLFAICYQKYATRDADEWPLILNFWWCFSFLLNACTVAIFIINHFKTIAFQDYIPVASTADFVAFPLIIILGSSVLLVNPNRNLNEIEQPLITRENSCVLVDSYTDAGIWSKLTFRWLNPIFEKGRTEKLELHHIPTVPETERAENSYRLLQDTMHRQKTKASSLTGSIIRTVWKSLALNAIFAGINTLSSYMGPLLITNFVEFLSGKDPQLGNKYGYMLCFLFFLSKTVESLSQRQWYFGARRIGVRVRAALMAFIYSKSLSTKYSSTSCGKIINFLDVDVERIGDFSWYFHSIWLLPIQVSLALLILYKNLGGAPSLAALLATILVMVSNTPLANLQERLHSKIMEAKDSRMKATTEVLKCMRILKLHSWENAYLNKLLKLRDVERGWLKRYLYTCSAVAFLFWASPTLVSVITFGVCIVTKTPLTPGSVLSALATFRILQDPIYNLPELVSMIAQTKVSIDRIQDFIKDDRQRKLILEKGIKAASDIAVEIEMGEYGWDISSSSKKPTIKIDNKITIMRGQKVAVCGAVGSGKSSFLYSIIGEIPRISGGAVKVLGSKAYAPQSSWIQTGTVRENVLFGKNMDRDLYDKVVKSCALDRDFELWVERDLTVVGERGMNLSGGQKQRIQLARAVYSDSDVYLLDDPFSAVDAHTGGHLFKECLMRHLSDKTVIYVTHQLEFLDTSDLILVLKHGKIVQHGKYEELISDANGELVRQMSAHRKSLSQVSSSKNHASSVTKTSKKLKQSELEEEPADKFASADYLERTYGEESQSGRVKWQVYSTFVTTAFKGALVPVILLCQFLFQGLQIASNYWIAWATEKESRASKEKLIGIFVLMSLGSSIFVLGRAVLLATVAIETSQKLFVNMTSCIFRAPIAFFDFTPSSRILNRSSTDQSIVDTDIPYRLGGLVFALVQLLCIIILMSQVAWQVLILFGVVIGISFWYQAYYITTARELARMVGIRKAPILHHLSESVAGAATIRCFNQGTRFLRINLDLIDNYSRITFYNSATMEWLSIRINFLFNLTFFIVLIILVSLPKASIDPSLAGLATTYGLNLNVLQAWVIWNLCNVENKMISVERILQFSRLPSEAPLINDDCRPQPDWPRTGDIEFVDLYVRYTPGFPFILKGISCKFPGKKKIGVVGRTGSGKSTLIQALFRVVEPSGGRIIIDNVDICQIGLYDLRSKLSIIPQDPSLFQGTLRTNLDPLQQHPEHEIWEALRKCHLGDIVMRNQRLLEAPVAEDGENWSLGQRQLVCLARALLKKRRILVLDEATASVDTATDNLIQRTIHEETGNCTVISVAHRIATVIDKDLVLVLDEGKIVEYDSPRELLRDKTSAFSKLVTEFLQQSKSKHQLSIT